MITANTRILTDFEISTPVQKAVEALKRDITNTCTATGQEGIRILLQKKEDMDPESFALKKEEGQLILQASDDLGMIYGIYHISKTFLGVNEFWFWDGQIFEQGDGYRIPEGYSFRSLPFQVKFRGWFINDEVLFDGWRETVGETFPWEMAFEALLRSGGNMTIPGTDANAHRYKKLAADYGLWITHHHAEPMGARMFARAYPDLEASFDKYPDLFRGLWKEALEDQKGMKVLWNIGFRGL